jgi:hypothetical protein
MDAINELQKAQRALAMQTSETAAWWEDEKRYTFYNNVMKHYDPETDRLISAFSETRRYLEGWLNQMRNL